MKKFVFAALAVFHEVCAMVGLMIFIGFLLGYAHFSWNGWRWPS